jgi:glycosyltransferase involved in cell wall biosynthesis
MPDEAGRRVFHVSPDGDLGGGAVLVQLLAERFSSSARPVIVTARRSFLWDWARDREYEVRQWGGFHRDLRASDVVHLHGSRALLQAPLARAAGTVVLTSHGLHHVWERAPRAPLVNTLYRIFTYGPWVDRVVCVGRHDLELTHLLRLSPERKVALVYNPLDVSGVLEGSDDHERDIDVLWVGRMVYQKDPLLMVEAAKRLEGRSVVLVGDGPMMAEVTDACRSVPNITVRGRLERPEVLRLIARSKVLASSSRWEGLPFTVAEGMALGSVAVCFPSGGLRELITDGVTGHAVQTRTAAALAETCLRALREAETTASPLRSAAKARVQELLCVGRAYERYGLFYGIGARRSAAERTSVPG